MSNGVAQNGVERRFQLKPNGKLGDSPMDGFGEHGSDRLPELKKFYEILYIFHLNLFIFIKLYIFYSLKFIMLYSI